MFVKVIYGSTGFRDTKKSAAKMITSDHCASVTSKLEGLATKYALREIATYDLGSYYQPNKVLFNQAFKKSAEILNDPEIILFEIEYIKSLSSYGMFIQSPFWLDVKSIVSNFCMYGVKDGLCTFSPANIKRCEISAPQSSQSGESLDFQFKLVSDIYYGDGINESIMLVKEKYRALTYIETAMLAIALSEAFPSNFDIGWEPYATEIIGYHLFPYHVRFCMVPRFKKASKPIEPEKTYSDIY